MTKIKYKLNKNLTGRQAAQLNWKLTQISSSIRIINEEGRMINAKSLIGLLSGCFRSENNIEIIVDDERDLERVKEALSEVGTKI